nr:hypothetical protein [Tanacetum cinerariifolium]GFC49423.1 hypothetical protein [Tanacetum cinerariifolium]
MVNQRRLTHRHISFDLDEDDDIIDDEDALPHDLADSDDEDLINVVDDDVVDVVYSSEKKIDLELQRHPNTQFGWQESGKAAYPPGEPKPRVKEDY